MPTQLSNIIACRRLGNGCCQGGGHQVLITGYNPETREIAWSDPWGRDTKERWMTMQEAQRCTLGEYYIITW